MASKIKYLHSDVLSVIEKEIELRRNGYQERDVSDEHLLERNEYLLRTSNRKKYSAHTGRHNMSIAWRTS